MTKECDGVLCRDPVVLASRLEVKEAGEVASLCYFRFAFELLDSRLRVFMACGRNEIPTCLRSVYTSHLPGAKSVATQAM